MSATVLAERLEGRAPGAWEIYRKEGATTDLSRADRDGAASSRRETGIAARWWDPAPRFAAASSAEELARLLADPDAPPAAAAPVPAWPTGTASAPEAGAVEPPADVFDELARLVAAESRGDATLAALSLRNGRSRERVVNAAGLDVSWNAAATTGLAAATGRRDGKSCEARVLFRADGPLDLPRLARRLSDRATLPLAGRSTPIDRGEWLLDVSVAAGLLAAIVPLFLRDVAPRWAVRPGFLPPDLSVVDDATADAPFDGEGTRTRRVILAVDGSFRGRLHDLASARGAGAVATGHGVRRSFRTPPERAPRRLAFETARPVPQRDLLASVKRGLFAAALTAPWICDLEGDRFQAEFTGVAVVAGRAQTPVSGARARGRLSELLRRIAALAPEREFFPSPDPVGSGALLIERASFE